jgi:hypothetical protein
MTHNARPCPVHGSSLITSTDPLEDAVDDVSSNGSACTSQLKNSVDNFAADGRTCTEDGSVSKLLAKLLAILLHFAGLCRLGAAGDVERHVSVVAGDGRRRRHGHQRPLFLAHVARGEDALHAGALVLSLPPLRVHVLGHGDLVVGHEGEIARVLRIVLVHRRSIGQNRGASGDNGRRGVGWRRRIGAVRVGVVADVGHLLLWGWRGCGRRLAVEVHVRHGLGGRSGEGARAVLSGHG